jgi:hypothetical protein
MIDTEFSQRIEKIDLFGKNVCLKQPGDFVRGH